MDASAPANSLTMAVQKCRNRPKRPGDGRRFYARRIVRSSVTADPASPTATGATTAARRASSGHRSAGFRRRHPSRQYSESPFNAVRYPACNAHAHEHGHGHGHGRAHVQRDVRRRVHAHVHVPGRRGAPLAAVSVVSCNALIGVLSEIASIHFRRRALGIINLSHKFSFAKERKHRPSNFPKRTRQLKYKKAFHIPT